MVELCNYLSNHSEVEVHLILLGKNENFFNIPEQVSIYEPVFSIKNKLLYSIKIAFYLRRIIKKIKPYSILSFGEMYNSFVVLATLWLPFKVFVSDRSKPDKKWGFPHEFLRKHLYRKSSGIICQTTYSQEFLYSVTKHTNMVTIPNPISFSKELINHTEKKEKVILTVGRLIKSKNINLLLEIFAELDEPDWNLWIVGDGPEKENILKLSNSLQIQDRVVFWGRRQDVDRFYQKASIFAFTSESEGFPNALLEAMAFSLPSISFNCIAGPSDLIDDGINGYLIPLKDKDNYIKKIQNLIDNEKIRNEFGNKARIKVQQFHIDKIGNRFFQFITQ